MTSFHHAHIFTIFFAHLRKLPVIKIYFNIFNLWFKKTIEVYKGAFEGDQLTEGFENLYWRDYL